MNLIKNNSVTNLAAKAFGPDVETIKGKTTRTNLAPAVSKKGKYQTNYWRLIKMLLFQWKD